MKKLIFYILTFLIIVGLILTNAVTDAPNAIATLVGTKVMTFRKAANLSSVCNFFGIIIMSLINISVANSISSMIDFSNKQEGMIVLMSGMIAVISFALMALKFGIPTSETHGLIAGITGAAIAISGLESINFEEWKNVIIGLGWSILGTLTIGTIIFKIFEKVIILSSNDYIKKWQIFGCMGMSFMHGAQDGQKFIGILIIFFSLINEIGMPEFINPFNNIGIIFFVAIIMSIGVSIGGRKIVENIGSQMVILDNKQALISDITTIFALFIASMVGLPVSTTHVKTVSIINVGKNEKSKIDKNKVFDICKTWIWNFPVSGIIGFGFAVIIKAII